MTCVPRCTITRRLLTLEEGRDLEAADHRAKREVLNYFAGLRYVEKNARRKLIRHEHVFELHRLLATDARAARVVERRGCPPVAGAQFLDPPLRAALGLSRQGALDLLNSLLEAGIVERIGTRKNGRYTLRRS